MKTIYVFNLLIFTCSRVHCRNMSHFKSRSEFYPRTNNKIKRLLVPDDKVSWDTLWEDYNPQEFTSDAVRNKVWADPEIDSVGFEPVWNSLDKNVDRSSFMGDYKIVQGYPIHPIGRTGLRGRGVLGRWGPNHAADPIVTSWKRSLDGSQVSDTFGKRILQFLSIQRRDNGEWAIPGGMVDPGELVSTTLKREFFEESLNYLDLKPEEQKVVEFKFNKFFSCGQEVYKGYVDDPRNTDNAWIETVAHNFHDETGDIVKSLPLKAGDDAVGIKWTDISSNISLYASHIEFIQLVAKRLNASW